MTRFTRTFIFALILLLLFGARTLISDRVWAESFETIAAVFPEAEVWNDPDGRPSSRRLEQSVKLIANTAELPDGVSGSGGAESSALTGLDPSEAVKSLLRADPELRREIFAMLRNEKFEEARNRLLLLLDSFPDNEAQIRTLLRLVRELEQNPADRNNLLNAITGADSVGEEISGVSRGLEQLNEKLRGLASEAEVEAAAFIDSSQPFADGPFPDEASAADGPAGQNTRPAAGAAPAADQAQLGGSNEILLRPAPLIPAEQTLPAIPAGQQSAAVPADQSAAAAQAKEEGSATPDARLPAAAQPQTSLEIEKLRSGLRVTCSNRSIATNGLAASKGNAPCLNLIASAFEAAAAYNSSPLAAAALDAVSRLRFNSAHPPEPKTEAELLMVNSIAAAVTSADDGVAWNGAAALGQIYPLSHPALLILLRSESPAQRARGAFGLGLARADAAVGVLGLALSDEDPAVRNEAVRALRRIGSKGALETFESYAGRQVPRLSARLKHFSAALADPAALEPDSDLQIVEAMRETASLAGSAAGLYPDLLPYLQHPSSEIKIETLETLAAVGAAEAAGSIVPLLASSDSPVSTVAAEALVRFGEGSVEPVSQLLSSPDKTVRLRATAVLGRLGKSGIAARDRLAALGAADQNELQASASLAALKNIEE